MSGKYQVNQRHDNPGWDSEQKRLALDQRIDRTKADLMKAITSISERLAALEKAFKDCNCAELRKRLAALNKAFREAADAGQGNRWEIEKLDKRVGKLEGTPKAEPIAVKITQPADGLKTEQRFIDVTARVDDPAITDGELDLSWLDGKVSRTRTILFDKGVSRNTVALGTGLNTLTVKVKKGKRVATDAVKVTCSAEPARMRVIMNWTGYSDLDLYVTDPSGATAYYHNRKLPSGAFLDRDDRRKPSERWSSAAGPPGPETFLLSPLMGHKIILGDYIIKVVAYQLRDAKGRSRDRLSTPLKAKVIVLLDENDPTRATLEEFPISFTRTKEERRVFTPVTFMFILAATLLRPSPSS